MFFVLQLYSITEVWISHRLSPAWNFTQDQSILASFHAFPSSCVSDTQQTIVRSHWKVASVNSSTSHRLLDFLSSIRASLLTVMLLCLQMSLDESWDNRTGDSGNSNQRVSSGSSCKDWLFIGKPQWSKKEALIPQTSQQNLQTKFCIPCIPVVDNTVKPWQKPPYIFL